MFTNVSRLQRGQPLTWSCLPSSLPKPHELPVKRAQTRKLSRVRSCAGVADRRSRKDGYRPEDDARKEDVYELGPTLQRRVWLVSTSSSCESSFLEQNRVTAATVQRYTVTLSEFLAFSKMTMDELKLLAKLDDGGGNAGTTCKLMAADHRS